MNVGDYVRYISVYNNEIKIRKIIEIIPPDNLIEENYYKFNNYEGTIEKDIIKSSPNIIDLIEVGDYVNGYEVTSKDQFLGFGNHDWYMTNDEIKSIVTKEQFESMEYRIESQE